MSDTLNIIVGIISTIIRAILFLGAAGVTYLVLAQLKVKELLDGFTKLTHVVVYVITTYLLYSAANQVIFYFLSLPGSIAAEVPLYGIDGCLLGLVFLGALIAGSILIVRKSASNNNPEP
ncbi:MAG: hypothetical protein ABFD14_12270 [Anaerolineaceae bacterium]